MVRLGRLCIACFAVIVLALGDHGAWSQPARTIKIVVPVPPGASTDFVARLMAEQISRAQGVTIVLVEQNANRALQLADWGYVMESGLISMSGDARVMLTDPKVRAAYLGE